MLIQIGAVWRHRVLNEEYATRACMPEVDEQLAIQRAKYGSRHWRDSHLHRASLLRIADVKGNVAYNGSPSRCQRIW